LNLLAASAAVLMSLAACGGPSQSAGAGAATGTPIQVGFTSDLSAQFATNGQGLKKGLDAYVMHLNKNGGVNNHPITVTYLDDAAQTARGTANVTQLATQQRVVAITGMLVSNICAAAAPQAEQYQIPFICNNAAEDMTKPARSYIFVATMGAGDEAKPAFEVAKSLVKTSTPKFAVVTLASAAIASYRAGVKSLASKQGWTLVGDEQVPLTASDVSAQVTKIEAGKPDVIVAGLTDPLIAILMRKLAADGVNIPVVDYDGMTFTALQQIASPNLYALNTFAYAGTSSREKGVADYIAVMKEAGVDANGPFVNRGYTQGLIVATALKACKDPCTGVLLQAQLDKLNIQTNGLTSGPIAFTSSNHTSFHAMNAYVWDAATSSAKVVKSNLVGTAT
jgi:branched-chain amino acid transport system substrate-binding protein